MFLPLFCSLIKFKAQLLCLENHGHTFNLYWHPVFFRRESKQEKGVCKKINNKINNKLTCKLFLIIAGYFP